MKLMVLCAGLVLLIPTFWFNTAHADTGQDVFSKALEKMKQGKFDEARKELNELRKKEPDNPRLLMCLAQLEEDYEKALWLYSEAEIHADSSLASEALFKRAELMFSRGDYLQSDSLYHHLVESYPENGFIPDSLYRMGVIRLTAGEPLKAIEYFNSCLEVQRDVPVRLYAAAGIMECYVTMENWNQALDAALAALVEKDDMGSLTPRILEVIALAWRNLGNKENADKFIERLLKNYPFSFQAHNAREEGKRLAGEGFLSYEIDSSESAAPREGDKGVSGRENGGGARYSVQAGAFNNRNNALTLLRLLRDAGLNARVDMKTVNDKHFFVIRVGSYSSREEAEAAVEKVTRVTGLKADVVVLN